MRLYRGPYSEPNPWQARVLRRLEWVVCEIGYGDLPTVHLVTGVFQKHGRRYDPIFGCCVGDTVWLDCHNTADALVDTMLHEVAHALAHRTAPEEATEHSALWGAIYAKVYEGWRMVGGPQTRLPKTPL